MSDEKELLTRRCFLQEVGLAGACAALMPLLAGCEVAEVLDDPLPEEIAFNTNDAPYDTLKATGDLVALEDLRVVLVRDGAGDILAFGRYCPHQNQDLADVSDSRSGQWSEEKRELTCRWHYSVFSETGEKVSGITPSGIPRYRVEYDAATGVGKVFGRQLVTSASVA